MVNRVLSLLLLVIMLFTLLTACQPLRESPSVVETSLTAADIVDAVSASTADKPIDNFDELSDRDPEGLSSYVSAAYGLRDDEWEDCAVILAMGASAYEIAVLRFSDGAAAEHGEECLNSYLKTREGAFFGYVPDQAELVANAVICRADVYVGLFICKEPNAAKDLFNSILETGKLPSPSADPKPEVQPVVDMRALMVSLIKDREQELDNIGGFSYMCSFDEVWTLDKSSSSYFFEQLSTYYGVTSDMVEAGFSVSARGSSPRSPSNAFELTALCLTSDDLADPVETEFYRRLSDIQAQYDELGLADQAELAENGLVVRDGRYIALFICQDPKAVESKFHAELSALQSTVIPDVSLPAGPVADVKTIGDELINICGDETQAIGGVTWSSDELGSRAYGLDAEKVESSFIAKALEPESFAFEVSLFRMDSEASAVSGESGLQLYLWSRKNSFAINGLSEQSELAGNGIVTREGRYLAVFVSRNTVELKSLFVSTLEKLLTADDPANEHGEDPWPVFVEVDVQSPEGEADPNYTDRLRFQPPGEVDMTVYDTTAILSAWRSGDKADLSKDDGLILNAATEVLNQVLTEDMDALQKEEAIYNWILHNVEYNYDAMIPGAQSDPEVYTPYGGLVLKSAVCLGYATTFQLLMDMAGIECITIVGASFGNTTDHSWNMVRLDGQWYCVDPTWDISREDGWGFFNVTSDYMARTNHQWDYSAVPEATTKGHGIAVK